MPRDVYRPDPGKIQAVKWLGGFLFVAVVFSLAPVARQMEWNLVSAPDWARASLLIAAAQAVFIVWLLAAPDWASLWVVMIVFALVAAIYGAATAIAVAAPPHKPMPLDLGELRRQAAGWCGAVMLLMALGTYLCGRLSAKWRRAFELEVSLRHRARRRPR